MSIVWLGPAPSLHSTSDYSACHGDNNYEYFFALLYMLHSKTTKTNNNNYYIIPALVNLSFIPQICFHLFSFQFKTPFNMCLWPQCANRFGRGLYNYTIIIIIIIIIIVFIMYVSKHSPCLQACIHCIY